MLKIEICDQTHPRWSEIVASMAAQDQANWLSESMFTSVQHHVLCAWQENEVAGFLGFVVWEIGPHDRDHPALEIGGQTLREAKIIAFGVEEKRRRQGIGRALQNRAIEMATELDCYQLRSVSGHDCAANHALKLSMGFGVEPMERDKPCLAFVMPLRSSFGSDTTLDKF